VFNEEACAWEIEQIAVMQLIILMMTKTILDVISRKVVRVRLVDLLAMKHVKRFANLRQVFQFPR